MTFQVVGSLLADFNPALNPYLYSFLGTKFAKRWTWVLEKLFDSIATYITGYI